MSTSNLADVVEGDVTPTATLQDRGPFAAREVAQKTA